MGARTYTPESKAKRFVTALSLKCAGAALVLSAIACALALLSYNRLDHGYGVASNFPTRNLLGAGGAWTSGFLISELGIGAAFAVGLVLLWGVRILKPQALRRRWVDMASAGVMGAIAACIAGAPAGWGGNVGAALWGAIPPLPLWASTIIVATAGAGALFAAYFSLNISPEHLKKIAAFLAKIVAKLTRRKPRPAPTRKAASPAERPAATVAGATRSAPAPQKQRAPAEDSSFRLPPLSLLNPPPKDNTEVSDELNRKKASMLEATLAQFGVDAKITNYRTGPVITLFEIEAGAGVKTSRITNLSEDIARDMSALSARVAVIAGTNKIGIELPNLHRKMVSLRDQFESAEFANSDYGLPIALGSDTGGRSVVADLAKMPHLLIAGTTGSGKSVGVNGMILSLLYRYTPDEVKFIMIDPKMLEFGMYNDIPHLLIPVVTEPVKAVAALKWAVREMEERNRNMSALGAKNIESYNAKARATPGQKISRQVQTGWDPSNGAPVFEEKSVAVEPMPYIVVIVDEIADLMLVAGKDVEAAIARLAAMARAAGIHLILSTQRPSVDVITGTIKSNFPNRIAYRVASKIDSRTIINEQGAELMLGKGDMLYMAMGGSLLRVHGAFVSEEEIERVVRWIKREGKPNYVPAITAISDKAGEPGAMGTLDKAIFRDAREAEEGDLYARAVAVVMQSDRPSISFLQRSLGIGYNKSANLIEKMQREGILSAPDSQGKRVVLAKKG